MNYSFHIISLLSAVAFFSALAEPADADYVDPDYAAHHCARQKGDVRACCDDMLEGTKSEVQQCIKLVPGVRKKLAEEKAARAAAKKAKAAADTSNTGASPTSPDQPDSGGKGLRGSWTTEFGTTMVIEQNNPFRARFNLKDGRMVGTLQDGTMDGLWIQSSSKSKCPEEREGSFYWGKIRLTFSGNTYTGSWGYCDEEASKTMKPGKRL